MLSSITYWLLAFALWSPLWATERPWDPYAKWERTIANFERLDQIQRLSEPPLLFVGSSSIRMWNLHPAWPQMATLNRGFGGSTIHDVTYFTDRVVEPYKPLAVVLYAGDNDVSKGLSVAEVVADYQVLSQRLEARLPGTPLIFVAIKPSLKRWDLWPVMEAVNDEIATLCAQDTSGTRLFADIASPMLNADGKPDPSLFVEDGLHLNREGYRIWEAVLARCLKKAGLLD